MMISEEYPDAFCEFCDALHCVGVVFQGIFGVNSTVAKGLDEAAETKKKAEALCAVAAMRLAKV
jgi:hypothetical protein